MQNRTYRLIAVGAAALVGAGALAVGGDGPRVEPAPVDALVEQALSAEGPAPETQPAAGTPTTPGVVSFATTPVEPVLPRTSWDLPVTNNERVRYWIDFLKGDNQERTHLWLEREGKYGPLIRARLRERGMPEDLLYLGMIESGLSPNAYSRAHAAGLWQFIAETGRRYGLEVSTYVDERRDPLKATDAALDYLSDLHDRFGSWYLAAAGYNSGENRVERILRERVGGEKGREALFWMIDQYLPRETRDYVPLMLAAGHIAKDPNAYGFRGIEHQPPLAFEEVEVPGGITLTTIARTAGVDVDAVEELNPHLVRDMTPPGRTWPVRVPVGSGGTLAAELDRLEEQERFATVVHRVRSGETLSHIARRYGVGVDDLRASNGWLNPRSLHVGQRLTVPVSGTAAIASSRAAGSAEASWVQYRVRRGDTLWGIARRHGVTVSDLRRWNGIGNQIYPGQRLKIEA